MSFTTHGASAPAIAPRRSIWRNRDLVLVTAGQGVSALGNAVVATTLVLFMQAHGHTAWAVAGVLAADMLPLVLLAPIAGVIVDRVDSRLLIVTAGVWQAACCLALASTDSLALVFPLVAAVGIGSTVALPAYSALLPRIVGEDRISKASSIVGTCTGMAAIAGPGIGGLLYATTGLRGPYLVDAVSFVVLAGTGMLVRTRRRGGDRTPSAATPRARDGIVFVWGNPLLRALIVMAVAFVVVGEAINVAEVYFVRDTLHQSAATYGLLSMTWAVLALGGSAFAGRFEGRPALVRGIFGSGVGLAGAVALIAAAPSVWVLVAIFVVGGACNGFISVCLGALLLSATPDEQRGRVMATFLGLVRAAGIGALGLGGLLVGAFDPRTVFAICGLAAIGALLLTARPLLPFARDSRTDPVEDSTTASTIERCEIPATMPSPVSPTPSR